MTILAHDYETMTYAFFVNEENKNIKFAHSCTILSLILKVSNNVCGKQKL